MVFPEDMLTGHSAWEMPSHADQHQIARMWMAGALSPGTGMGVGTDPWDAICQLAMFTIIGKSPASWSRNVDTRVHEWLLCRNHKHYVH